MGERDTAQIGSMSITATCKNTIRGSLAGLTEKLVIMLLSGDRKWFQRFVALVL